MVYRGQLKVSYACKAPCESVLHTKCGEPLPGRRRFHVVSKGTLCNGKCRSFFTEQLLASKTARGERGEIFSLLLVVERLIG